MGEVHYSNLLSSYTGSGNPKGIWFVGMEWADWGVGKIPTGEDFNGDCNIPFSGKHSKSMFGNIGIITKKLRLEKGNLIVEDGIEKIVFNKNGDLFWINTSLLAFPRQGNDVNNKLLIEQYKQSIDGLEGLDYYSVFWKEEYLAIRKSVFQKLILNDPKFIFCIGNNQNYYRLFSLLGIPNETDPIDKIKVQYNSGKSKYSETWFYEYNGLKIAVCPFFNSRWSEPEEDLQKICDRVTQLL